LKISSFSPTGAGLLFLLTGIVLVLAGGVYDFTLEPAKALSTILSDLGACFVGGALTVLVIDAINKKQHRDALKQQLKRELGSSDNGLALRALAEIRAMGWLVDGSLDFCDLSGAMLANADMENASLKGVDFSGANLTNVNLSRGCLANSNLRGANLTEAILESSNLSNTILSGASMKNADIAGADAKHADLSYANLADADLREVDLRCSNLTGAVLVGANVSNVISDDKTTWPVDFKSQVANES